MNKHPDEIPIACQRLEDVFNAETRQRHRQLWNTLQTSIIQVSELESGFAFHFPMRDSIIMELAEYLTYERKCCPFFHFNLEMNPAEERIVLRLTGRRGTKEFLEAELANEGLKLQ